jgi:hypothetical protein
MPGRAKCARMASGRPARACSTPWSTNATARPGGPPSVMAERSVALPAANASRVNSTRCLNGTESGTSRVGAARSTEGPS